MRRLVFATWLGALSTGCFGLGDFDVPVCSSQPTMSATLRRASGVALRYRAARASTLLMVEGADGVPEQLAWIGEHGSFSSDQAPPRSACPARTSAAGGCEVIGFDAAPVAESLVVANTVRIGRDTGCDNLRVGLAPSGLVELAAVDYGRSSGTTSIRDGIHLDASGCTQGGVQQPRVASASSGEALVVWLAPADSCGSASCWTLMSSQISIVPPDLYTDDASSLRALGQTSGPAQLLASNTAAGYFVAFLETEAARIWFVPMLSASPAAARPTGAGQVPARPGARELALAQSRDGALLAAAWAADGDMLQLARWSVAASGSLQAAEPLAWRSPGQVVAGPVLTHVESGLLDWSNYTESSGWLVLWVADGGERRSLRLARVSDDRDALLGAPIELASGDVDQPFFHVANETDGPSYGFVRGDAADHEAKLGVYPLECALARKP